MSGKKKLTIFYDGQCTMCSSLVGTLSTSKKQDLFLTQDMHTSTLPKNVTLEDINKEIYVTDSDGAIYKNADAILKITEEYFAVKHITTLGRLPVLRQILTISYNCIAANRHLFTGKISSLFWIKITTVLAFLASILISTKLWLSERLYPLVPVIQQLPPIPYPYDYGIFIGLLSILICILIIPQPKKYIWVLVGTLVVLIIGDQSRLQPWVVQYIFILSLLAIFSWKKDDNDGITSTLTTLRIVVAFTYLYSGLQKINLEFVDRVMPWVLEPVTNLIPSLNYYVPLLSYSAPCIQIFFALGLLTQKYRRISLILAVTMHLFILAMIGPLGHNWNSVVWPWTAAMAIFDIILFSTKESFTLKGTIFSKLSLTKCVVIIFFVITPLLSFYNRWDSYLSSALYSGNITAGTIYVTKEAKHKLPAVLQGYFTFLQEDDVYSLPISMWSIQELGAPSYPETRIYKQITKKICIVTDSNNGVTLRIQEHRLFNSRHDVTFSCKEL